MRHTRRTSILAVLGIALACALPAHAAGHGTREQAVAMVKHAIEYIRKNGRDKAFAEFERRGGPFHDRDLYITVTDFHGKTLSHGANPRLIGKVVLELKDANGKAFIREFADVAQGKGSGWVDYDWPNPVSGAIEHKSTYVEKYEDMVVGCGIYR